MISSKVKSQSNSMGLSQEDVKCIVDVVSKYPQVEKVLVFGSRAKGIHERGSDVDLCLKGVELSSSIVSQIHWTLEEETLLPYFFDVVHYEGIENLELKSHIDRRGKVVYERP